MPDVVYQSLALQVLDSSSVGILTHQELHHDGQGTALSCDLTLMLLGQIRHCDAQRIPEGKEFHQTRRCSIAQGIIGHGLVLSLSGAVR